MTFWKFTAPFTGQSYDYPTLGFFAADGAILDGTASNPAITVAPDSHWAVVATGPESGITRYRQPQNPPDDVSSWDGSLLVYDATQRAFVRQAPSDAIASGTGLGTALGNDFAHRSPQIINLSDRGLVSGATDQSAIISQAQSDLVALGGGVLLYPSGAFYFNVTLATGVKHVGISEQATLLYPYDLTKPVFTAPSAANLQRWGISQLTICGRMSSGNTTQPCIELTAPAGYWIEQGELEDIHFLDWWRGIHIQGNDPVSGNADISFAQFLRFTNLDFQGSSGSETPAVVDGVLLESSFENCHFHAYTGAPALKMNPYAAAAINTPGRVAFRNCAFVRTDAAGYAISLTGGRQLVFDDCYFELGGSSVNLAKSATADELSAEFRSCRFWHYTSSAIYAAKQDLLAVTGSVTGVAAASTSSPVIDCSAASPSSGAGRVQVTATLKAGNHSASLVAWPKPTAATLAANGTSAPAPTLNSTASDEQGVVSFGSGTAPASGAQVRVTFAKPYPVTPTVVVGSQSANDPSRCFVTNVSASSFDLAFSGAPAASQSVGVYAIAYTVQGVAA